MVDSETEGRAEALRRIAFCRETRAEELDLGGLMLTTVPDEVYASGGTLGWVKRLYLGVDAGARETLQFIVPDKKKRNAISALPSALFDALSLLEKLDLALNNLRELPGNVASLTALTTLDLMGNGVGQKGARHLAGLTALTSLDLMGNGVGPEGARHLADLTGLTSLNLAVNGLGDEGARHLAGLTGLTSLNLASNNLGDEGASHLAGLTGLTSLNLASNNLGDEGASHLAGLTGLTSLNLADNGLGDEGARQLAGLTALISLNLASNNLGQKGARHLAGLTGLTNLDLAHNELGPEAAHHLAGLTALTSLDLRFNELGADGLRHLAGLTALTSLNLAGNHLYISGALDLDDDWARHLIGLTALTRLDLTNNLLGDYGARALAGLTALTSLNLAGNGLGDDGARALAGLTALTSLNLSDNRLGDDGARALAGLTALTSLNLASNNLGDIAPLLALPQLESLDLSHSRIDQPWPELWRNASLRSVTFEPGRLAGVPDILLGYDCLPRLRSYFADLDGGSVALTDVKVMLLGNGRVGKTKIARRLAGEPYGADDEPSTHGVHVKTATLPMPAGPVARLRVWDFGGQDIYHGTHALFLKSRAIFPIVWTPACERERQHTHGGFPFRNQPLAYWLAYVLQMGGARSPVIIVQSQADTRKQEEDIGDWLDTDVLDSFEHKPEVIAYSAKTNRKRGTLDDALIDAVATLRHRDGQMVIPKGWAWVKTEIEKIIDAEQKLQAGDRHHQLATLDEFAEVCEMARQHPDGGPVDDDAVLLGYLHDTGTVYWRDGQFGNRTILDQQWALDAVYAIFDREKSWPKLKRYHGRFTRSDLAELVWGDFKVSEQELFLSFMRECGIAFVARRGDGSAEAEYVAPDLLPGREDRDIAAELRRGWNEPPDREVVLSYDLLAPGLMRSLIASIGEQAGDDAVYWSDGFLIYDEKTKARGLVEQSCEKQGWAGTIRIATEHGSAAALFDKLISLVDKVNKSFSASAAGMPDVRERSKEDGQGHDVRATQTLVVRRERPPGRIAYVSYAWADPQDPTRAEVVDRLCAAAKSKGIAIQRDIETLKVGDNIRTFMKTIGAGDRIFIALSDKYWRSAYCMCELYEVWRNCRLDIDELRERTRVFALPSAKLSAKDGLEDIIAFWNTEHARIREQQLLEDEDRIPRLTDQEVVDIRMMRFFISQLAEIRGAFRGVVRAGTVEEYIEWALVDMVPDAKLHN